MEKPNHIASKEVVQRSFLRENADGTIIARAQEHRNHVSQNAQKITKSRFSSHTTSTKRSQPRIGHDRSYEFIYLLTTKGRANDTCHGVPKSSVLDFRLNT